MAKNKQSFKGLFVPETQKEINLLSQEISKRKKEIDIINKEINNIKDKSNIIQKKLNKYNNEIIVEEKNITELLTKKNKIKSKQKMIINSINKEIIIILINSLVNIEYKNIKEIIVLFFNFKNEFKDELKIIIKNKESFVELMINSYKYIKFLAKEKTNQFNEMKQKIKNVIENNAYINIDKIKYPFDFAIDFIKNCFELIDIRNKIIEINEIINGKNINKNKIFLNKIILEENLQVKEQELFNLETYIKNGSDIVEKYKNGKNQYTEKEIFEMIDNFKKKYINNKQKITNKIGKNNIILKTKNINDNLNIKEKEREKDRKKSKKNIISQDMKDNNKVQYITNKIYKNSKIKELSCI